MIRMFVLFVINERNGARINFISYFISGDSFYDSLETLLKPISSNDGFIKLQ